MKIKEFYDHRQAHAYLSECIVIHDGEPVYVNEIYQDGRKYVISYYHLPYGNTDRKEAYLDDGKWDFTPVSLGYTSTIGQYKYSNYASRVPQRAWKIGLTVGNLNLFSIKPVFRLDKRNLFFSENLKNTVLNRYPKYSTAYNKKDEFPTAFSKRFAIFKDDLFYKSINVPAGKAKKDGPELNEKFKFLQEVLDEDLARQGL